jgi:hypothetical protein
MGSSTPDAPKVPSYAAQMNAALKAQERIAPRQLALEQQYQPQFTALNLQTLGTALGGTESQPGYFQMLQDLAPQLRQFEAGDIAAQRQTELGQFQQFAPQYVQAYRQAAGTQALLSGLQQQAQQELAAGTSLTPEEQRQAQQAARGAYASRGMGLSNRAIGSEILSQYGLGQQRLRERQAAATGVAGMLEASGLPQYYANMQGQSTLGTLSGLAGQAQGLTSGRIFNPESQMAMDISGMRSQTQAAASAAGAANRSAMAGAGMGLVGSGLIAAGLF